MLFNETRQCNIHIFDKNVFVKWRTKQIKATETKKYYTYLNHKGSLIHLVQLNSVLFKPCLFWFLLVLGLCILELFTNLMCSGHSSLRLNPKNLLSIWKNKQTKKQKTPPPHSKNNNHQTNENKTPTPHTPPKHPHKNP